MRRQACEASRTWSHDGDRRLSAFSRGGPLVRPSSTAIGSLPGVVLGYALAFPVTDLFASQVSLPLVYVVPHWDVMAVGVALSVAFSATAGTLPAYRASREKPAETIRGDVPRNGARRMRPRQNPKAQVRVTRRIPLRQLKRNPLRSAFTVLALALAGSLIIVPFGFLDSMDTAVATFARTMNFDLPPASTDPCP